MDGGFLHLSISKCIGLWLDRLSLLLFHFSLYTVVLYLTTIQQTTPMWDKKKTTGTLY